MKANGESTIARSNHAGFAAIQSDESFKGAGPVIFVPGVREISPKIEQSLDWPRINRINKKSYEEI